MPPSRSPLPPPAPSPPPPQPLHLPPPPPPTARAARRALVGDGRRVEALPLGVIRRRTADCYHPHHPLDGGTRRPSRTLPHPTPPASTPQPAHPPPPSPLSGCEALCSRLGIMVRRAHLPRPHPGAPRPDLAAPPPPHHPPTPPHPQALKSQYGQGYKVDLRLDGAAAGTATAATAATALAFVAALAGAALEEDEPPTAAIRAARGTPTCRASSTTWQGATSWARRR